MRSRNRIMLASACVLMLAVLLGDAASAKAEEQAQLECSPCTTHTGGWITHSWELSCCDMDSPGCYMYPDSQQSGNGGSCQGMHRPCTSD